MKFKCVVSRRPLHSAQRSIPHKHDGFYAILYGSEQRLAFALRDSVGTVPCGRWELQSSPLLAPNSLWQRCPQSRLLVVNSYPHTGEGKLIDHDDQLEILVDASSMERIENSTGLHCNYTLHSGETKADQLVFILCASIHLTSSISSCSKQHSLEIKKYLWHFTWTLRLLEYEWIMIWLLWWMLCTLSK